MSCIRSPVVRRRRPSPRKERSPLHIRQVMIGSSDMLRAHRMSLTGKKQDCRCRPPPRASRRYPVATGLLAIPPLQHPLHSSQSPGCQQLLLLQSALNSPPPSSPTAAHAARLAAQERKDGVKSVAAAAD